MPKYYCDYCDIWLTHDSKSVRRSHNEGWRHKENVRNYYNLLLEFGEVQLTPEAYAMQFMPQFNQSYGSGGHGGHGGHGGRGGHGGGFGGGGGFKRNREDGGGGYGGRHGDEPPYKREKTSY